MLHRKSLPKTPALFALLALLYVAVASAAESVTVEPPNIVLIVADDVGYGDVSAFWPDGGIHTPNIDRIAAAGARLTNFHVQPVCATTRAALLTGRYHFDMMASGAGGPAKSGIPPWATTIPEYLRAAGYRTGAFGKWHLSSRKGFRPFERGFEQWLGFYGGAIPYSLEDIERYRQRFALYENAVRLEPAEGHTTDLFADRAIAFLEAAGGQPFFLYLSFNAAHTPLWRDTRPVFSAREDWLQRVREEGVTGARRQDYVAVVRHMDARIGDLLDALERLDLTRRTLVVFLSDNGADTDVHAAGDNTLGSNGPFRGGKSSVYEGALRVPFAIQWPGMIPPGQTLDEFTTLVDIWPTLLEVSGTGDPPAPGRSPPAGVSLLPLLTGTGDNALPAREGRFIFPLRGLAVIAPPWKLVRLVDGREELYNLGEDPGERHPLNNNYPAIRERLSERADDYFGLGQDN